MSKQQVRQSSALESVLVTLGFVAGFILAWRSLT